MKMNFNENKFYSDNSPNFAKSLKIQLNRGI